MLLETDRVLRSLYGYDDSAVRDAFASVLGLENVQAEDEASVAEALVLSEHGMEFADALHLTSRPAGTTFVSFDKTLIRRARRARVRGVSAVPSRLKGSAPNLSRVRLHLSVSPRDLPAC